MLAELRLTAEVGKMIKMYSQPEFSSGFPHTNCSTWKHFYNARVFHVEHLRESESLILTVFHVEHCEDIFRGERSMWNTRIIHVCKLWKDWLLRSSNSLSLQ